MIYNKLFRILMFFSLLVMTVVPVHSDDISKTLYNEGLRKYILKEYNGAIKDFEAAYSLNKTDSKIKGMYINSLVKQGNIDYQKRKIFSSQRHYSRALALSGRDTELRNKLNRINEEIERIKKEKKRSRETAQHKSVEKKESRNDKKEKKIERVEKVEKIEGPRKISRNFMPFNMEKFIQRQDEENKKILSKIIEAQERERESFHKNLKEITKSQFEDRRFFSYSLLLIIIGSIVIFIIIAILILKIIRKQSIQGQTPQMVTNPQIEYSPELLLEYTENIEESKYLTHEKYSDLANARHLRDLYSSLKKGDFSWEILQQYITELNHELKSEVLNIIEEKIQRGDSLGVDNTLKVLMPFITDGDIEISSRSRNIAKTISESAANDGSAFVSSNEINDTSETLSVGTLLQFAIMSDEKTGRKDHSVQVAEISYKIAEFLNRPGIDPQIVKKVGLIHDIGYLEIDDNILRKEKNLTKKQFAEILTHTEKGLKFIKHADPPDIFTEGIRSHHERLDGTGYPDGLEETEIPFIAKIIAVADFFAAITSPRPHRDALSPSSALEIIEKVSGKHYDNEIVNALKQIYQDQTE